MRQIHVRRQHTAQSKVGCSRGTTIRMRWKGDLQSGPWWAGSGQVDAALELDCEEWVEIREEREGSRARNGASRGGLFMGCCVG